MDSTTSRSNSPALLKAMERHVDAECAQLLTQAREERERLLAEARDECARQRDEAIAQQRKELEASEAVELERLEGEARMAEGVMRQTVCDEALVQIEAGLGEFARGHGFDSLLLALLEESMGAVKGSVTVRAPAGRAELCRGWLDDHGFDKTPVAADESLTDGVVVEDADRTFRLTNTLASRFEQARQDVRRLCLARLFGEGDGHGRD